MIRKATANDLATIIEMGYQLCDRTPLAHAKRDRPVIAQTIGNCMVSQYGCCFVTERGGRVSGVVVGIAQQLWFSRQRQATDLMITASHPGDGIRLLRRFIDWGWSVPGVIEVACAQSSGIEVGRTAKVYERVGFQRVGGVFSMTKRPPRPLSRAA